MLKRGVLLALCSLVVGCVANASTIIYNNLSSTTNGTDPVNSSWGPLADSFSTPASGFSLTDVQVLLEGSPSSGSTTVSLLSDSSTSPGALLTTIGTLSDTSLSGTLTVFNFPLLTPYNLAGSTRYWIELSANAVNSTTAVWAWSTDQSALGVAGEYFANQQGTGNWLVFPSIDGPYQMELSGTTAAEPGSLLLLAIALLAIIISLRRNSMMSGV